MPPGTPGLTNMARGQRFHPCHPLPLRIVGSRRRYRTPLGYVRAYVAPSVDPLAGSTGRVARSSLLALVECRTVRHVPPVALAVSGIYRSRFRPVANVARVGFTYEDAAVVTDRVLVHPHAAPPTGWPPLGRNRGRWRGRLVSFGSSWPGAGGRWIGW